MLLCQPTQALHQGTRQDKGHFLLLVFFCIHASSIPYLHRTGNWQNWLLLTTYVYNSCERFLHRRGRGSSSLKTWPVLYRLGQMIDCDLVRTGQISYRARQLENTMEGPRREV